MLFRDEPRFPRDRIPQLTFQALDLGTRPPRVLSAGVVRTARKLFDGTVYPAR